jgi:hypothetical protein
MTFNMVFIDQVAREAERLLAPLGNRWLHVQGVAERARQISIAFDADDATYLVAAAYLHDIGYAPALKNTAFHPIDGAYYVRSLGHQRLASLVAHHSEARFEARLRGLGDILNEFPRERSAVADALTYCDQTTSPTGKVVSPRERATEVFARYGEADTVSQACYQALPYISLAIARTQRRLRMRDIIMDT